MMKNRQNKHKGISQRLVIIGIGVLAVIVVTIIFFVTQQKQTKPTTAPATLTTYQVKRHELRLSGRKRSIFQKAPSKISPSKTGTRSRKANSY